jgi:hypothetical protein
MANGNKGIGGFLPFPTFGGQQSPGITPVTLQPSPVRFPTPRGPVRRAPEPTTKEKYGSLAPIAVEGLLSLFDKDPEILSDEEYLSSLGGLSQEPTLAAAEDNRKKLAMLETYKQFGPPEEKDSFGLGEIAHILAAGSMDRGAKDYADTYMRIRKGKEDARLAKGASRGTFLTSALEDVDNLTYKVFEDADKARLGVTDRRSGFADPRGDVWVMNDDKTGYTNIKALEGNWIEQKYQPSMSLASELKDPRLQELMKYDVELNAKDTALISTVTLANEAIKMFDAGIADPTQEPLTVVTSIGNLLNSATANFEQIGALMGGGNVLNAFADADDLSDGTAGSIGREGSGQLAKRLYQAIQSGDDAQMKAAMQAFEEGNPGTNFKASLGDMAYNNVRTRATMLQLAYMAAAANGQTGRTLSDKDLAFHLEMVGFGATQDAQTAKDNLLGFVDTLVNSTDNTIRGAISQNRLTTGRYPLDDEKFTQIIAGYWIPPTVNGKPDWLDAANYEFKDFYKRFGDIPDIKKYREHTRRKELREMGTERTEPRKQLQKDLDELESLY